ncbi:BTAD domain-containing putative transcriptional regulator [Streptomyces sp. NPDC007920]|uniref:AfsR/SARP family transcriptional regulator n=1 Tax=Streptomyces sp. NPDC007920 TaxID=3364794 RepID=UPI0036E25295
MTSVQANFFILGRLEVTTDGELVALDGTKPRLLLATLLLNANRTVSNGVLIEALWLDHPPSSAAANLRTHISSLRRSSPAIGTRIATERTGYSIFVAPGECDLDVFGQLVAEGRRLRAANQYGKALAAFEEALAVWRDEPLSDLPRSPLWTAHLSAMTESRRVVSEELLELRVELGCYAEAEHGLRELIAEEPLRESIWAQLMLALEGAGRRADALSAYSEIRHRLVAELGIEPGPELRRIHEAILSGTSPRHPVILPSAAPAQPGSSQRPVERSYFPGLSPLRTTLTAARLATA